jgi:serine/threonine-protein kinase
LLVKIASGGMATVYVGRLRGAEGFWRLVAIKRAHGHLVEDPAFRKMLISEARLASRIHHPNVVSVEDVEELQNGELRLVMDYVEGSSLYELLAAGDRATRPLEARLSVRIALDACAGLHAAHELTDDRGETLRLVHRDVSPQNILVGVDGTARLADFGIAKVARSSVSTTTGAIKGKMGYMAPEYIEGAEPDARSDVFALGVVVWEALAHKRLFRGQNEIETLKRVVGSPAPPLSSVAPSVGPWLDDVLAIALSKAPGDRFDTAQALGAALETAARKGELIGAHREVASAVKALVGAKLDARREQIRSQVAPDEPSPPSSAGQTGSMPHPSPPLEVMRAPEPAPPEPTPPPEPPVDSSTVVPQTLTAIAGVPRASTAWLIGGALAGGALLLGAIALGLSRRSSPTAEPGGLILPASATAPTENTAQVTAADQPPAAAASASAAPSAPTAAPTARSASAVVGAAPRPPATDAARPRPPPSQPTTPAAPAAREPVAAPRETVAPNPYAPPKP